MSFKGPTPSSPDLVRRAIDLSYANHKRSSSLKWSALNGILLLLFAYDLSCKCPGYTSYMHYVELALASVLCANLLQHAYQFIPKRDNVVTLTQDQQRLLGLSDAELDSTFRVVNQSASGGVSPVKRSESSDELSISLSPRRTWRSSNDTSPSAAMGTSDSPESFHSTHSPHSPLAHHSPNSSPPYLREPRDEFIANRSELADYLRQYEERARLLSPPTGIEHSPHPTHSATPRPPPRYQLASPREPESGEQEEGPGTVGALLGSPRVWWRLHLDPQRLTQFNLNLRLWLQVTILERLVREIDLIDAAFVKHGLHSLKIGEVSVERLRKLAGGAGEAMPPGTALAALLPFLEPFPDQRYVVCRIKELARGGCLSDYRWNGGGTGWEDGDSGRPTDAELILELFCAYMDGVLPSPPPRPFSSVYISRAPAQPPALAIHRTRVRPPHYVLSFDDDTLEVVRGRNNLLHTLLLFLAAAARRSPPALGRLHLGRAGLNMLWIIGR